jgi:hypothetical protein
MIDEKKKGFQYPLMTNKVVKFLLTEFRTVRH